MTDEDFIVNQLFLLYVLDREEEDHHEMLAGSFVLNVSNVVEVIEQEYLNSS